ncbi:hypothetical protein [Xanthomonas oryzae]|uniref:Uncharacterized protein n=1 Tax=Xanthomonas oryzae pv. leersiae TaxID=3112258 RepID=A0AAJ6KP14_9XANT|nr:hypothetical protein [Xanthomonas oryzae]QBG90382.1 hypothetical protein EYR26_00190 [Xanthomonas oryzae]UNE62843.1 hypothetical protein MML47_00175 [Xanthomonas oryzae]WIX06705.1 hypothetical protein QN060_00180 [Xanthomonas oryzae pv. oryzae]
MTIAVYIDSCAWNYLHEKAIDLLSELPPDKYALYLTREVEIELEAIPDGEKKQTLKDYIKSSLERSSIRTTSVFGFQTDGIDGVPSKVQVYRGFGQGTFQSATDRAFYASPEIKSQLVGKKPRKSGLSANQADASLAARSFGAFVLTTDKNKGPLKTASELGGKIVYLTAEVEKSGLTLGQYMASLQQAI